MSGHPRYTSDEIALRGQEWYDREIRAKVEPGNKGRMVAIDIETGEYEIDDDRLAAAHRALAKHPDAALYGVRVGYPTAGKIGGSWESAQQ